MHSGMFFKWDLAQILGKIVRIVREVKIANLYHIASPEPHLNIGQHDKPIHTNIDIEIFWQNNKQTNKTNNQTKETAKKAICT
jgi:hypothetical protein